jgi:hypothetical protein
MNSRQSSIQRNGNTDAALPPSLPVVCAVESCDRLVLESWEETGRLCAQCAIEIELADRELRRFLAFPS